LDNELYVNSLLGLVIAEFVDLFSVVLFEQNLFIQILQSFSE